MIDIKRRIAQKCEMVSLYGQERLKIRIYGEDSPFIITQHNESRDYTYGGTGREDDYGAGTEIPRQSRAQPEQAG